MSSDNPKCPECGSEMILRTAKKGPNRGGSFWGCSSFPKCRGLVPFESDSGKNKSAEGSVSAREGSVERSSQTPVPWSDRVGRQAWIAEYSAVGSLPEVAQRLSETANPSLVSALSQTFFLFDRNRERTMEEDLRRVGGLLTKILQRGRLPLPTLGVERGVLVESGLQKWIVERSEDDPEISFELSRSYKGSFSAEALLSTLSARAPFEIDNEFDENVDPDQPLFDSDFEKDFLLSWVPKNLGASAGNWFLPQVNLDRILEGFGSSAPGSRRIDFLFCSPGAQPLAIEIDGPEHEQSQSSDSDRDDLLASCGIRVIRILNSEIEQGTGIGLDAVFNHCSAALLERKFSEADQSMASLVWESCIASKVQLAIAKSLQFGWLSSGSWNIKITGGSRAAESAVCDVVELIAAFDKLYDTNIAPFALTIESDNSQTSFSVDESGQLKEVEHQEADSTDRLVIKVERDSSPFAVVKGESLADSPDVIIRPAYLPVQLAVQSTFSAAREKFQVTERKRAIDGLTKFLQHIFRKRTFRHLQADPILNPLRQQDCVVLLPTGAGKSIIYQLAGMLLPGVTLVIDPLVSLIEDQVQGLAQYGIDRAVPISSVDKPEERARLLKGVERGEYQFILMSPERLQSPKFRETLRALVQQSQINLAVIDEAHCVSEWGHDFRPAYLNLARNLREFAKDSNGVPPPILSLTGTASRAVLRDVLTELDIDRSKTDALIRPDSFDRKELQFDIRRVERVADAGVALNGVLGGLPDKFGVPADEFFRPSGKRTQSGIVFVPFVNGKSHGVTSTLTNVRDSTRAAATYYSGKAPKGHKYGEWEQEKRENVKSFKSNQVPILVSTKAFGMGIDKPNIRYTIHFGMPSSLEAFYQEAGRAGRDRRNALCTVVFTEFDGDRTDRLLDPSLSLDQLRERYDESHNFKTNDDAMRALFFHLNAFVGSEKELSAVRQVLSKIETLAQADLVEMPFEKEEDSRKFQEKAIYRLVRIGAFKDYEVDYGARKFHIHVLSFDLSKCKERLLDYVQSAQPGRVRVFARSLESINSKDAKECAVHLAKLLIEFTYDVIERSRRRGIQESILLARNAKTDKEVRLRLLDYLQEGLGAENFDKLLDEKEVSFKPWMALFENISTAMDAGEIRGLAIRSLESFPDHPGLLLTRGVSEMMCTDPDENICHQVLHSAISGSVQQYDINEREIGETLSWLADMSNGKVPSLGLPFAVAYCESRKEGVLGSSLIESGNKLLNKLVDDRVRLVLESFDFVDCSRTLVERVTGMLGMFDDIEIRKTLGS